MSASTELTFTATLEAAPRGGAALRLPPAVDEALGGGRGRVAIRARFDDAVDYRGSVVAMGGEGRILGMTKAVREALGKDVGDEVRVKLTVDAEPRRVEVPEDVAARLAAEGLREVFDALSYTHRKEYVRWIEDARREATRQRRLEQLPGRVREGRRV